MKCIQCSVTPDPKDGWLAKLEHRTAGPYRNLDIALRIAIDEAQRIRRAGREARIVVYNADHTIAAEYRLCTACTCEAAVVSGNPGQLRNLDDTNANLQSL